VFDHLVGRHVILLASIVVLPSWSGSNKGVAIAPRHGRANGVETMPR